MDAKGLRAWTVRRLLGAAGLAARAVFPHFCVVCGDEGRVLCDDASCRAAAYRPMRGVFVCPGCGASEVQGVRCGACRREGVILERSVSGASYGARPLRELLRLWKYEGVEEAGNEFRSAFRTFLSACAPMIADLTKDAVLVPVPCDPLRKAARGFDQAAILCRDAAEATGCRVAGRLIVRRPGLARQAGARTAAERRRNVTHAFAVPKRVRMRDRIVLVDDVVTSGSTAEACARALIGAGAKAVSVLTALRG